MEQTLKTTFAVLDTRTNELYDGPFYSMVNASRIASDANERARAAGRDPRYFVVQS
jgi:hypothetical protein